MKRIKHIALAAATMAMVGVTGSALAAVVAENGIATTKHNLSSSGTFSNKTNDTTEICVFCHTPHGADTSQSVPLWNRTLTDTSLYTTYAALNSSTLDGTITTVGSVSLACLSCHDGTIAMDSIVNTPGSGTTAGDAGWTFETGGTMSAEGKLLGGAGGSIAMLGVDLSNDHPVGIPYAGGGVTVTDLTSDKFTDADFKTVKHVEINTQDYWYVPNADITDDKRTRSDIILYTRTVGSVTQPYVECASCHDPHVKAFDTNQVAFLRITNAGSKLCLACHDK